MSSHGHRHFRAEFSHNRMVGQKYFYTGTGNNVSVKFDIKVDWLMIFGNNGTKYGIWDYDNNQCLLSGDFNSNPSVDNSILSSDNINFIFDAVRWSVLNDEYCVIAFGCSPRETNEGVCTPAFHKHTHGYDEYQKTQMRVHKWTGSGVGVGYATFRFNYAFAYVYNWTVNQMYFLISPYAYLSYGSRNAHKQGYNATNPSYELNVLNTDGSSEALKETGKPGGVLDLAGNQYYAWAVGVYDESAYIFKGGAYPGHKHFGGWNDYNRVIGTVGSYTGNGVAGRSIEYKGYMNFDVLFLFRQDASNNDIYFVKVLDYISHDVWGTQRLTKAATSVSVINNGAYFYGPAHPSYMKKIYVNVGCNENNINYHFVGFHIVNPKTVV